MAPQRKLFAKPPDPDQKREARIARAQDNVNALFGVRGTGRKNIAPSPAQALTPGDGAFAGAQSQTAGEALGITKLLWRT